MHLSALLVLKIKEDIGHLYINYCIFYYSISKVVDILL